MPQTRAIDLDFRPGDDDAGHALLTAPRVGAFTALAQPGQIVQPGETVGLLEVLNQVWSLRHPTVAGPARVAEVLTKSRAEPVGFGQSLIVLQPVGMAEGETFTPERAALAEGLPENARPVAAPVDGQFYRRPSPDEPAFVEVGAVIARGAVVGLVEVMKFFYEVALEDVDAGTEWRVERVVATDGSALGAGDPIIWIVPAS